MKTYTRTADEEIYVRKRYERPKEAFKQIGTLLHLSDKTNKSARKSVLDIGCATGELLYYLRTINLNIILCGIEYSKKLVERSRSFLARQAIKVSVGDAERISCKNSQFDFVISSGVTSIFDDFRPSFEEMIRVAKSSGVCLNLMMLNELPIDVIIKYVHPKTGELESGWNKFSMHSIDNFLQEHPQVKKHTFVKHTMPFDIPRTKDLMRSWTVKDKNGKRILWNGLNMEISIYHVLFEVQK